MGAGAEEGGEAAPPTPGIYSQSAAAQRHWGLSRGSSGGFIKAWAENWE